MCNTHYLFLVSSIQNAFHYNVNTYELLVPKKGGFYFYRQRVKRQRPPYERIFRICYFLFVIEISNSQELLGQRQDIRIMHGHEFLLFLGLRTDKKTPDPEDRFQMQLVDNQ